MKILKTLCLVLCLGLCLCGCQKDPAPPQTTAPAPTQAPTTEAAADPRLLYQQAADAFTAADSWTVVLTRIRTLDLAGEVLTEEWSQTVTLGPDGVIQRSDSIDYGLHQVYATELWSQDTAYLYISDQFFRSAMEQEAFLDRLPPLQLLQPDLYADAALTQSGQETVITFSQPQAPEAWLDGEGIALISAQATATLDAQEALTGCTYQVSYGYGGVTISEEITAAYSPMKAAPTPPDDPEKYLQVESIDALRILEQAYGPLMGTQRVSARCNRMILSQAAGFAATTGIQVEAHQEQYRVQSNVSQTDINGTYSYTLDERFLDGSYTASQDGGDPVPAPVTAQEMEVYAQGIYLQAFTDPSLVGTATVTDLGSLLLAEFTGSPEWGPIAREDVCAAIFQDPGVLDNAATSVSDDVGEFYVAVDKYTGLATAAGYCYAGTHVIEGTPYQLTDQLDVAMYPGSLTAREAITDTPADAQAEAPTPLFYHVTGPEGQEMWLLGTIHVGDDRTAYLPQQIRDALAASDALALECDTDSFLQTLTEDPQVMASAAEALYFTDGTTAADHIASQETYDQAIQVLKATGNYFYNILYTKPSQWSSMIDNFYLQQAYSLTTEKGLEARLKTMAQELGLELREVESALFQLEMMGNWSDALQELLLRESLVYGGLPAGLAVEELYAMWCAGDAEGIAQALERDTGKLTAEEQALYAEYDRTINHDRNITMLEVAKDYLESGDVVFYAVGLAHLLADNGLVTALAESGYTVEQVTFGG